MSSFDRIVGDIAGALLLGTIAVSSADSSPAKGRGDTPKPTRTYLPVEDLPSRAPPMAPEERAKVMQELTALRERQKMLAAPNGN
ncbi:hypothetical protein [Bradyrhizobium sp. 195]|uniref:hypothetical protein n=1 Tax=Bradyrhizobium sp. 195 TaxID=2782662 RepID=UPI0020012429|nr:hypothetical protein [Bradyrhizobium sp. 195]UPK31095.1 hypothetical protein IVB26_38665 [Bradyrhizobium sp. 195]